MRFGQLLAFGSIQFGGVGAVSRAVSGWPLSFEGEYDTGLVTTGALYPYDTQGLSAAPLKSTPQMVYEYLLYGGIGVPAGQAFAQLEQQWLAIYQALAGSYSWPQAGGATTSGQKGTLLVADADPAVGATYIATARILRPAPWKIKPGSPYALSVELTFALLSDFTAV